jgi:hypothetical protein
MEDFIESNNYGGRPYPALLERHELNEADDDTFFAGEDAKRDDLIFVEAAHEHAIHLHRPQLSTAGGTDSGEDTIKTTRDPRNPGKALGIDGIHTDRDAIQAGLLEWLRHVREEMAVGRDGKVKGISVDVAQLGQAADEIHNAFAQKRLPSGEANLLDPERYQDPRHAEIFGKVQLAIDGAFVAGPAVDATIVASIGYGNPQVGYVAAEFVGKDQLLAPASQRMTLGRKAAGRQTPTGVSFPMLSFMKAGGAGVSTGTLGKGGAGAFTRDCFPRRRKPGIPVDRGGRKLTAIIDAGTRAGDALNPLNYFEPKYRVFRREGRFAAPPGPPYRLHTLILETAHYRSRCRAK